MLGLYRISRAYSSNSTCRQAAESGHGNERLKPAPTAPKHTAQALKTNANMQRSRLDVAGAPLLGEVLLRKALRVASDAARKVVVVPQELHNSVNFCYTVPPGGHIVHPGLQRWPSGQHTRRLFNFFASAAATACLHSLRWQRNVATGRQPLTLRA